MVSKLVLLFAAAVLVTQAHAHCHPYPCDKAKVRLQLCLNNGYQPEKLEGCKVGKGDWEMSEIQKGVCKKLEESVEKEKCDFECLADEWTQVNLSPDQGQGENGFQILSDPVPFEAGVTKLEWKVTFLKEFTKMISFDPYWEFLDEQGSAFIFTSTRAQYFYNPTKGVTAGGWISNLWLPGSGKSCRALDSYWSSRPVDQGIEVAFLADSLTYEVLFENKESPDTVDMVDTNRCSADFKTNDWEPMLATAKKVRFKLVADKTQVPNLGEFISVKYKFSKLD